jgi:hypothetical protein
MRCKVQHQDPERETKELQTADSRLPAFVPSGEKCSFVGISACGTVGGRFSSLPAAKLFIFCASVATIVNEGSKTALPPRVSELWACPRKVSSRLILHRRGIEFGTVFMVSRFKSMTACRSAQLT